MKERISYNGGFMKQIDSDKKLELIKQFDDALKKKDFLLAIKPIHELIAYQQSFLDDPECLEDQIELMSLSNNLYRFEHISQYPTYYKEDMYKLISLYQGDDLAWKIDKLIELYELVSYDKDFFMVFNLSFELIQHYRLINDKKKMEETYHQLFFSLKELEQDLVNYAHRIDKVTLNMNKTIEDKLYYQLNRNPIEQTKRYQMIKDAVDEETHNQAGQSFGLGFCHVIWEKKKNLLKEKYGIDWHSPQELNDAHFD